MSINACSESVGRKVTARLIVPFLVLIVLNSIDRVNVSFAALRMNADIGLNAATYGFGVGLFFVGYICFQVPSLWLLDRFGMRRWIFAIVLSWGFVATAMAFIHDTMGFYVLRLALGVAEAGFAPGVVLCCTRWMPRRFRAGAISMTMIAIPISIIIGGPLSGWLMEQTELSFGIAGWRWMFLIEGAPTIALAIVALWFFVDTPREAKWLTHEERQWLEAELEREAKSTVHEGGVSAGMLLRSGRVWACALAWLGLLAGAYGLIYWLPLIIKELSRESDLTVGVLSALPWIGVAVGMIVNARHSDRTQERHWHVVVPSLISAAGLSLAAMVGAGWIAMILLMVGGFALGAAQGTFWAIPTTFLAAGAATVGIPLINMIGGFGGVIGPGMIGLIKQNTGSYALPVYAMAAMLVLGALLIYLIRPPRVHR